MVQDELNSPYLGAAGLLVRVAAGVDIDVEATEDGAGALFFPLGVAMLIFGV